MNEEMNSFIKSERAAGTSDEEIRASLSKFGWKEDDILNAFNSENQNRHEQEIIEQNSSLGQSNNHDQEINTQNQNQSGGMNKLRKYKILIWAISILVGVYASYQISLFVAFVILLVISTLICFGAISLFITLIDNLKKKNFKKVIEYFIILMIFVLILYGIKEIADPKSKLKACFTAMTPHHFRTNIFTGKCDYGGGAGCIVYDPWYYKQDCALGEDKVNAVKNSGYYFEDRIVQCEDFCIAGDEKNFCREHYFDKKEPRMFSLVTEIDCTTLISCDNLSCIDARKDMSLIRLAKNEDNAQYCYDIKSVTEKDSCLRDRAYAQKDVAICTGISDINQKSHCVGDYYRYEAFLKKDLELCEVIVETVGNEFGDAHRERCFHDLGSKGVVEACDRLSEDKFRKQCKIYAAEANLDYKYCIEIENDKCVYETVAGIAPIKQDEACQTIMGTTDKNQCFEKYIEICRMILSDKWRDDCIEDVSVNFLNDKYCAEIKHDAKYSGKDYCYMRVKKGLGWF